MKGLSKGRYDETFAGEDVINLARLFLCDDAVQRKRNLYASYI